MWSLVGDSEDFGFYLEIHGKPPEHFKQMSDMTRPVFYNKIILATVYT